MFQNWNHRPGMIGNTARGFLGKDNVSAVITGVDENVIHRFGITLKISTRDEHNFNADFLLLFYMFRTSYVHHQEDVFVHAVLCGMFFLHFCKQSSGLEDDEAHPPSC